MQAWLVLSHITATLPEALNGLWIVRACVLWKVVSVCVFVDNYVQRDLGMQCE